MNRYRSTRLLTPENIIVMLIVMSSFVPIRNSNAFILSNKINIDSYNHNGYSIQSNMQSVTNIAPAVPLIATFDCNGVSEIPQSECQALVALYTSTDGPHWTSQAGWLTTLTPCSWYGISCGDTHVININMSNNGLRGTLPVSLANLTNLHWLILPFNRISGSIPTELSSLSQVESIDLFQNQLTGEIPIQLSNLANLVILNLEENKLSGVLPPGLGNLSKLEYLYLGHNQLTGNIPSEFGLLSNVRVITLHDNQLTGTLPTELGNLAHLTGLILWINQLQGAIPVSFGNLTLLQQLALSDNQLSGPIPPDLGKLSALQELNLSNNQLTGQIPVELSGLVNLQYLYLSHNQLTGQIPPALGNLINLRHFTLYENLLSGVIPSELGNLVALEELDFGNAGLHGEIPASLTSLSQLRKLQLWDNQLQGEIPSGLSNLSKLKILALSKNQLTGVIPVGIGNLTGLTELYLDNNRFSGPIPAALGTLTNAITLTLDNNELSGAIPPQLGQMSNLRLLNLGKNKLSGTIPVELGNLSQLMRLYLWLNQLQGSIPASLGNLSQLQILGLSDNQLSGSIPPELGKLNALEELNFSNNLLTGAIPPELGTLVNLQNLYLSHNQLNGTIPSQLGNLTQLRVLHLGENRLTGALPAELGKLSNLELLILWNNNLSGTLPDNLAKLVNLKELSLNDNALQGAIPSDFGNLTKLEQLNLGKNQLSGSIPASLGNLTVLHRLYLNHNQLSGTLPAELGNLTQLEHLILWVNQMSGPIPFSLGKLTNLTILGLSENGFTGTIPPALGNLGHLTELHLHTNKLQGSIPSELGQLTALIKLYLNYNALSGEVPPSLLNLSQLTVIDIGYNMLSVSDPALFTFLINKNPNWLNTQTATPRNLHAQALSDTVVQLAWDALPYREDGGGYRLNYGTTAGGPYSQEIAISNKLTNHFNIGNLVPGSAYYFVLRAYTPTHAKQQNELLSPQSQEASVLLPLSPPPWVVMVYLNGDNDLDHETFKLFNQLESAVYNEPALIIQVLWDRFGDNNSALYQVQPDNKPLTLANYQEGQNKWSKNELDMGDRQNLLNFITETRNKFPARHYLLSIVDHGGGWSPKLTDQLNTQRPRIRFFAGGSGFSWDETSDYDYLSTGDMGYVFSDQRLVQNPIDIVFYDACLMGMLEEAYEIRKGAHFLIASQYETWTSFPYAKYLENLNSRSPKEQAVRIVQQYHNSLPNYAHTMSVMNLAAIDAMTQTISSLASALSTDVTLAKERLIREAYKKTQKLDFDYDLKIDDQEGYIDLGDFAVQLKNMFPNTDISTDAQAVLQTLHGNSEASFIVEENHLSGYAEQLVPYVDLDNVTGLSIYLPFGKEDPDLKFYTAAGGIAFVQNTVWADFIFSILKKPQSPDPNEAGGRGGKDYRPHPLSSDSALYLPYVSK